MERAILHIDCNKFYASVEGIYHPELKDKPFAVGGNSELRHGIILTKNEIAAYYGIKTGETLNDAFRKCPSLTVIHPDYHKYERYSSLVRTILREYSDRLEPFGLDECWLDLTHTRNLFGDEESVANRIRERIKSEVGITVSVGVSFNKTFAKLGSDFKKPDAVTVFSKENFREKVWPLPLSDLIFAGRSTTRSLGGLYIRTIGDLAQSDPKMLEKKFGKNIRLLYDCANGNDFSPVAPADYQRAEKSLSNSMTLPRDLKELGEIKATFFLIAENLSARLYKRGLRAKKIGIYVRDNNFSGVMRQKQLPYSLCCAQEIASEAMELFLRHNLLKSPVRLLGIALGDFDADAEQIRFFGADPRREKRTALEKSVNELKGRFGADTLKHAVILGSQAFDHPAVFGKNPFGYLNSGNTLPGS